MVYGSGDAVTAGSGAGDAGDEGAEDRGPGENRYLFITADFDPKALPEPRKPADTSFQQKAESEWTDTDRVQKDTRRRRSSTGASPAGTTSSPPATSRSSGSPGGTW